MNLQFLDSYPYRTLEPDLQALMLGARRLDAAVAFVTRPGVALLRQYLKTHPPGSARLVASVRFPTDLRELANLEDDFPGTVFLHTGFQTPIEKGADRGQFHSKVVLLELDGTERCVVLGSHNWTGNALHGHNMEAGMILRCQAADPIVAQVRQHIEACACRSEPFSRQRLRFYETIQRDLHRRIGPRGTDSEDFPGFEPMDALVMHAEDATGSGLPRPLQLFISVRDGHARDFFPDGRRVLLYVYPAGRLLGQSPPTAAPVAYEGSVTMTNVVRDASAEGRPATCRINDLGFRVFKLDSSNIRAWEPDRENLATTLEEHAEHLKTDRTEADILFELLLKLGLDLTVPIEQKCIAGKTVHSIGAGTLLVCLSEKITAAEVEPLALGIVDWYKAQAPVGESTVVFRDSAFADDVAKTNLTAILQQNGFGDKNIKSL